MTDKLQQALTLANAEQQTYWDAGELAAASGKPEMANALYGMSTSMKRLCMHLEAAMNEQGRETQQ